MGILPAGLGQCLEKVILSASFPCGLTTVDPGLFQRRSPDRKVGAGSGCCRGLRAGGGPWKAASGKDGKCWSVCG